MPPFILKCWIMLCCTVMSDTLWMSQSTSKKKKIELFPELNSQTWRVPLLPCCCSSFPSSAPTSCSLWHLSSEDIKASPRLMLITDYSWNNYEVRNYYDTQFIDKKTGSEFSSWENWLRNLLKRVRNWLEMTDVRLNPWIPGSQPQRTHAHFSAVSNWTQGFCPGHQSSCRQLKVFLPRPRAIHYITLCPHYNKVVPLKPILQSPTGAVTRMKAAGHSSPATTEALYHNLLSEAKDSF